MPIQQDSRYASATLIIDVIEDPITGERSNEMVYLDDNRTQFSPDQFQDNITYIPEENMRPDQVANAVYGRPDLGWVVGEFNDFVGFDMFKTFTGLEVLILPSPETLFTLILGQ